MILGIRSAEVRLNALPSSAPELRTAVLCPVEAMNTAILGSSTKYLVKGYSVGMDRDFEWNHFEAYILINVT